MNETASTAFGGIGERLRRAFARRVVWLTDRRRDSTGTASDAWALVVLLGREHYSERRKQYPILSRRDLDSVLKQELAGAAPTLTAVSGRRDDRREVTFFEIKPGVLERVGRAVWLVPESLAIAGTLEPGRVATVERDGFRYFVSAGGQSQPAGGAVTSAELFATAAGLDAADAATIEGEGLHARLMAGLRRLPLDAWVRLRLPSLRPRLDLNWQPLAWLACAGLVAYLVAASAYLTLAERARERELRGLGGEVDKLLVAQRDVDRLLAQQAGLAAVMADRRYTYRLWHPVAVAWGKGAVINSVQLQDSTLTIRGTAPVATDVLAAVESIPGFADAKFSAPVRRDSAGREEFSLALTMGPEKKRE